MSHLSTLVHRFNRQIKNMRRWNNNGDKLQGEDHLKQYVANIIEYTLLSSQVTQEEVNGLVDFLVGR